MSIRMYMSAKRTCKRIYFYFFFIQFYDTVEEDEEDEDADRLAKNRHIKSHESILSSRATVRFLCSVSLVIDHKTRYWSASFRRVTHASGVISNCSWQRIEIYRDPSLPISSLLRADKKFIPDRYVTFGDEFSRISILLARLNLIIAQFAEFKLNSDNRKFCSRKKHFFWYQ